MPLRRRVIEYLYCKAVIIDDKYLKSALELDFDSKLFSMSYYETCKWKILHIIFLLNLILLLIVLIPIVKKKINKRRTHGYNKALPDDVFTDAAKAISKTWMTHNTTYIETFLSDNLIYVGQNFKTIKGKDNYIDYLTDKFVRDRTSEIKIHPIVTHCDFYKHSAVVLSTKDGNAVYLLFRIENGLITHLVLTSTIKYPIDWTEEEIKPCLTNVLEPKENQLPCLTCGTLSEDLQWILFCKSPTSQAPLHGCEGELSICPKCKKPVEFRLTVMF